MIVPFLIFETKIQLPDVFRWQFWFGWHIILFHLFRTARAQRDIIKLAIKITIPCKIASSADENTILRQRRIPTTHNEVSHITHSREER